MKQIATLFPEKFYPDNYTNSQCKEILRFEANMKIREAKEDLFITHVICLNCGYREDYTCKNGDEILFDKGVLIIKYQGFSLINARCPECDTCHMIDGGRKIIKE